MPKFVAIIPGALIVSVLIMGFSMSSKFHLFSEVNGLVQRGGQPVAEARVKRTYHWGWKDTTDEEVTTTNAAGEFSFPAVVKSSFLGSILPHEPLITQKILITADDVEYKAWYFTKHNYEENGELGGKPIRISCELQAEPSYKNDVFGICTIDE